MRGVLYNDNDPVIADWISNLISRGLIHGGDVISTDIRRISPAEASAYTQCHFFAGICGWPRALQIVGWPVEVPVWTGSPPCQPWSQLGLRRGAYDERHLWPGFRHLIEHCKPAVVFGEQVESRDGRKWLAGVRADLEELGYAVGAADLCAPCVGAPHIRQRLYWGAVRVADGVRERLEGYYRDVSDRSKPGRDKESETRSAGSGSVSSSWSEYATITCEDGKTRRVPKAESILQCVVNGVHEGLDRLRPEDGYPITVGAADRKVKIKGVGNAIVPAVAAKFVAAFMDSIRHVLGD